MAGEKVLIVDDKKEIADFCDRHLLRPFGYLPMVAQDGRSGLEMALAERPDLMILDFRLPGLSGLEVLARLREEQVDIPVIFITGYGSDEDIISAFRLGVKDCFTKPFNITELVSAVQRTLSEKKHRDQQVRRQRELERQVRKLGTLYGSSVQSVLNHIVEAAVAISAAEEGYLFLVDEETDELYVRSALNLGQAYASELRLRVQDTIAGRVFSTGQPVRYNNIDGFNRFKVKTGYLVRALINVPLRGKEGIIGVLGVSNRQSSETFSKTDEDLLLSLGAHAATAIANASLYEQTHEALMRRVKELSVMQQVAHDLNGVVDARRIAQIVLHHAVRIASADAGLVGLQLGGTVEWVSEGYITSALRGTDWRPRWDAGAMGKAAVTAAPLLLNAGDEGFDREYVLPQTACQLVVPIVRDAQVLGIIDLESTGTGAFSGSVVDSLVALADRAAVVIENTRLFDMVVNEQRKTKLVLQSIADGVYTVDRGFRITAFNPAAERITGWSEVEVLGQPLPDIMRDADGGKAHDHQYRLVKGAIDARRSVASEPDAPPIFDRNGREVFVSSSAAPILSQEGEVEGAVVVFRDVSSERELDRLKSDFVSMISHELRAPLANLSAAIELMLNSTSDQAIMDKTLDIARTNEQRLTRLVENILSVSQIEAGQMLVHREPVTLIPILRRAIRVAQARAGSRQIQLKAEASVPYVMADQGSVEIVISNLLANALNYSPEKGKILVKVAGPVDDEVVVSVVDEGVGIPEEHLDKVFDRFYRVDTSDGRKVYGYGLGLYISKHLVELQGGRIWVESKVGYGSCFSFALFRVKELESSPVTDAVGSDVL